MDKEKTVSTTDEGVEVAVGREATREELLEQLKIADATIDELLNPPIPEPDINSIQVYKYSNGYTMTAFDEQQPATKKVAMNIKDIHAFVDEIFKD